MTGRYSLTATIPALCAAGLLVGGCDGSDNSARAPEEVSGADTLELEGTLVAPRAPGSVVVATAVLMANDTQVDCPSVPAGYRPLGNAVVTALDAEETSLGEVARTDGCGEFSARVPEGTALLRARADGFRDVLADVEIFTSASASRIASTIPVDWNYRISSLHRLDDGRLAFTITDDQLNRAVIGIPAFAFSAEINQAPAVLSDLASAASSAEDASIGLVLDASGSMSAIAYVDTAQEANNRYTRWHLTSMATHLFLDQKGANDEVGIVIFDRNVHFLDDDWIRDNWTLRSTLDGALVEYTFSEDGFSRDAASLRLLADAFSPYSPHYANPRNCFRCVQEAKHPDAPQDLQIQFYRWGGSTALYAAVHEGLATVERRPNSRRFVVTMGDGGNNAGRITKEEAIDYANDLGIAIYAIGLGVGDPDRDFAARNLRDLAEETGGTYFGVESLDLAEAFESIQTGVLFQYLANISPSLAAGDAITLRFDLDGQTAERSVVVR